jgi:dTDP-4-amino-4,6-dideoxygalactose transaminase
MSEVAAASGSEQLKKLDALNAVRLRIGERINEGLAGVKPRCRRRTRRLPVLPRR